MAQGSLSFGAAVTATIYCLKASAATLAGKEAVDVADATLVGKIPRYREERAPTFFPSVPLRQTSSSTGSSPRSSQSPASGPHG